MNTCCTSRSIGSSFISSWTLALVTDELDDDVTADELDDATADELNDVIAAELDDVIADELADATADELDDVIADELYDVTDELDDVTRLLFTEDEDETTLLTVLCTDLLCVW